MSESGRQQAPPEAVAEWDAAIGEYHRLEGEAKAGASPTLEASNVGKVDPGVWHTDIVELQSRPPTPDEYALVLQCLRAVDEILADDVTLIVRLELAAVMMATACSSAYDSASAMGEPEEAQNRYDFFEHLAVRRSRELYEQRRA